MVAVEMVFLFPEAIAVELSARQLVEIDDDIPDNKIAMRRINTVHNEVLYMPDGYITAWFMWQLQNDDDAAKAFVGDTPELLTNPLYQDQRIDME